MWSPPFQAHIRNGRIPSAESSLHLWNGSIKVKVSAILNHLNMFTAKRRDVRENQEIHAYNAKNIDRVKMIVS